MILDLGWFWLVDGLVGAFENFVRGGEVVGGGMG